MSLSDPQVLHDLNADDIVVTPLRASASSLVLTGIDLCGFERVHPIRVLEWKGKRRKRATSIATAVP